MVRYDPLNAFIQEIKRYPLLKPDEERQLAEEYVETQDPALAARLVTSNLRLVVKIAFEYRRAYRNIMDLIQEGNVGLMHAVKKFDPTQGVKLSSYSAWWIRAYILRYVLSNWRMVKIGTTQAQRKLFFNLNKERQRLEAMGIEPTSKMLAQNLQVKEREVIEMEQRMGADDLSLNAEIGNADGRALTRQDTLPAPGVLADEQLDRALFDDELRFQLERFGQSLEGKEALIFRQRLLSETPRTLQEIGDDFSISRERVRQIEKKVLIRLRSYLELEMNEYFSAHP
ncbi:MAG: RNA polymerase factor sigma-32 [Proteobacteria bacterium]|nr:RNA polymerase factor sigma-32 [Pseudomonadota bacterium]